MSRLGNFIAQKTSHFFTLWLKDTHKYVVTLSILFSITTPSFAREYVLPPDPKDNVVGELAFTQVQPGDDFAAIARRYDVGFDELQEANGAIDPERLLIDAALVVPTQYVLPPVKREGIIVNVPELRLYYFPPNGHSVFIYPVALGRQDWRTPLGTMKIIEKKKNPVWIPPASIREFRAAHGDPIGKVVPAGKDNPLGDYAMRLSRPTYLIHGTDSPQGVGRTVSADCIRMYPEDIKQLFGMVKVGTSVTIINEPVKIGQLGSALFVESHPPLTENQDEVTARVLSATKLLQAANGGDDRGVDWAALQIAVMDQAVVPRKVGYL